MNKLIFYIRRRCNLPYYMIRTLIIFGKIHFLLISKMRFLRNKCNRITSFVDFMICGHAVYKETQKQACISLGTVRFFNFHWQCRPIAPWSKVPKMIHNFRHIWPRKVHFCSKSMQKTPLSPKMHARKKAHYLPKKHSKKSTISKGAC